MGKMRGSFKVPVGIAISQPSFVGVRRRCCCALRLAGCVRLVLLVVVVLLLLVVVVRKDRGQLTLGSIKIKRKANTPTDTSSVPPLLELWRKPTLLRYWQLVLSDTTFGLVSVHLV